MALGSFIGKGFQLAIDNNSKLNWCFFISRLALKENINFGLKRIGFKLTKNKVTEITNKEKCFLEFLDHWGQTPTTKTEFWSLESFIRIGELTYSYFSNRCGTNASLVWIQTLNPYH